MAAGPLRGGGRAHHVSKAQNPRPKVITFVLQMVMPLNSSSPPFCSWPESTEPISASSGDAVADADKTDQRRALPCDDCRIARAAGAAATRPGRSAASPPGPPEPARSTMGAATASSPAILLTVGERQLEERRPESRPLDPPPSATRRRPRDTGVFGVEADPAAFVGSGGFVSPIAHSIAPRPRLCRGAGHRRRCGGNHCQPSGRHLRGRG